MQALRAAGRGWKTDALSCLWLFRLALVTGRCDGLREIRVVQEHARWYVPQGPVANLLHGESVLAGHL